MKNNYYIGIGRRKEATARVYLKEGKGEAKVNEKKLEDYFYMDPNLKKEIFRPLIAFNKENNYDFFVRVKGGGFHSQAEAIRLGITRSILLISPEYKKVLRSLGLVTRDSRSVLRKLIGKKKHSKSKQYSKR